VAFKSVIAAKATALLAWAAAREDNPVGGLVFSGLINAGFFEVDASAPKGGAKPHAALVGGFAVMG